MQIERFEFYPGGDQSAEPGILGLNINKSSGLTHINLFALSENKGAAVSDHLWHVARQIVDNVLMCENIENVRWTFTSGFKTTALKFSTLHGNPFKLDISDDWPLRLERHGSSWIENRWSLDRYAAGYDGQPPSYVAEGRVRKRTPDPEPRSVFSIPCNNPAAKDGVFYCQPSFYDSATLRDNYEYIMVDTKKLIAQLKSDNPEMLDHAERKFRGGTAEQWLETTAIENPRDMGMWRYSPQLGLTMSLSSGDAALIKVVQELDLPYFPIAVEKATGQKNIQDLIGKIGYDPASNHKMSPAYSHKMGYI